MRCAFLTHPEVVVDPAVPIEHWGLSRQGEARAGRAASVLPRPARLVSSAERKALDTAAVLARSWQIEPEVDARLGEMDRSATGYLDPLGFEPTVDAFFARPLESVRGWERAVDAQRRVEHAVRQLVAETPETSIVFVAHGGVGALLLASLTGAPISRDLDQPGMGSIFRFDPVRWEALSTWQRID
jgi:broad specificity phosphatase PhoE